MKRYNTVQEISEFLSQAMDTEDGAAFMFIARDDHMVQAFHIPGEKQIRVINTSVEYLDATKDGESEYRQYTHNYMDSVLMAFLKARKPNE